MSPEDIIIDAEFKALIPPLSEDELLGLRDDIYQHGGCINSVIVWKEERILLDGHNRYDICFGQTLKFAIEEKSFPNRAAAMEWMIRHQLGRRNISVAVRVELNLRLESLLAPAAQERKKANLKRGVKKPDGQTSAHRENGRTKDKIAAASGCSHDTVSRVKAVMTSAPEPIKQKMRTGEMSINEAYKKTQQAAKSKEPPAQPADPPSFDDKFFDVFGKFAKKLRELAEDTNVNLKLMSHQLHGLAKEFE